MTLNHREALSSVYYSLFLSFCHSLLDARIHSSRIQKALNLIFEIFHRVILSIVYILLRLSFIKLDFIEILNV